MEDTHLVPVGIEKHQQNQNHINSFPNPFTTSTTIEYKLDSPGNIQIAIYNHLGVQVEFIEKKQSQGKQQVVWDAEGLPAGIYLCVLKTDKGIASTRLIKLQE